MDFNNTSNMLKALGHPVRLKMAFGIAQYGCHVNKMVEKLGLPQSTVSQHLAILRNAGIVTFEKKGLQSCYCLADKRMKKLLHALKDF